MVEHLPAEIVNDTLARIAAARRQASEAVPESRADADDPSYWQGLFETNADAVLGALPHVRLSPGHVVRYRFYGRQAGDLLVRPFVTRRGSDASTILRLLDWHDPPDAPAAGGGGSAQDVELLYRHFAFERSATGVFEYWLAIQELWASQRWIHSTVISGAAQLAAITGGPDWRIEHPVERAEPAVVMSADGSAQIAVLLHSPLGHHAVTFHRICIGVDQSVVFAESLPIAHGPRGYLG